MSASRLRGPGIAALVLIALVGVVALRAGSGARAAIPTGLPVPEPDLSLPAIPKGIQSGGSSFVMLGADSAGDVVAYTMELPGQPALAQVNGVTVPSDWSAANRHFVIYERTPTGGWHLAGEALDSGGAPIPAFMPTGYPSSSGGVVPAGSVAPGGSAAIAGATSGSSGPQVILVRDPGGAFKAAPTPPPSVLAPSDLLFDAAAPVLAAVDDPGHGGVFVAPAGGFSGALPPDAVLHYDGTSWSAEPILSATGGPGAPVQRVIAISVVSPSDAYLLAQGTTSGAGVELYRRETGGASPAWVRVSLDGAQGAMYAVDSGSGYSALGPLYPEDSSGFLVPKPLAAPGSQTLTATSTGAWIDGAFTDSAGTEQHFTLNATVTERSDGPHAGLHAWCTEAVAGLCDDAVAQLPGGYYRSMAWPGAGPYGQRVITGLPGAGILSLQGTTFASVAGPGDEPLTLDGSAAFVSPTEGWTGGAPATYFTTSPTGDPVQAWPAPFREPLTAIAPEPGKTPGAIDAQALAVGANGEVARYTPGLGWASEPLLTGAGVRATPTLRGVAWPEEQFAYAVGDGGAMWRYDRAIGLWEADPAKPLNFIGDLTGVAFDPNDPTRGYAVGLDGVLLSYGKTWSQEALPAGLEHANFTSITFAGSEAIAAFQTAQAPTAGGPPAPAPSSGLLINTGSGWQLDAQEQGLTTPPPSSGSTAAPPAVSIVAGLPDGGAVAAGDGVLLERDSATAAWRLARDPLPGYSVVAAAAIRVGPVVQALLSVDPEEPQGRWPNPSAVTAPPCAATNTCTGDQGLPVQFGAYDIPANGWLVRETATGWQDIQHNAYPADYSASGPVDNPARDDEVQALLVDPTGSQGWAVGGESGIAPSDGQASSTAAAAHLHTSGIYRYPASATPPTGASQAPPSLPTAQVTVALAGDATCLSSCAVRDARAGLGPPIWVDHAISSVAALSAQPGGPRAFIYTGGIVPPGLGSSPTSAGPANQSIAYFAAHTQAAAGTLPFAPVLSSGEVSAGAPSATFMSAFTAPPGVRGNFPDYYAFDVGPSGAGSLRVVVIDDATPSAVHALASADTTDPQYQFLMGELTAAHSSHIPTIVVGSATLSTLSVTGQAAPAGAGSIAQLLVANGVSAYFFESPDSNAQYRIPSGAPQTIPSFGTGSLSYQAWANSGNGFGESGYLLASVDVAHTDPITNRAPVSVRLIPNISELAINALDGTVLQRSEVALFSGLARRPRAGTGQASSGALVGPDPYIAIPPATCSFACAARIEPDYTFTSSHPDIGNFVEQDPASQNPRAVLIGSGSKPVLDSHSGLFCAFNAGKTTVTVTTGALSFSETITVLGGQIRFPCGTTPLINPPVKIVPAPGLGTPVLAPTPTPLPVSASPPPPPPPAAPAPSAPAPAPAPAILHTLTLPVPQPPAVIPFVPRPVVALGVPAVPLSVPPPPPPPSFPSGFSGVPVPITQPASAPEERKEEEHATEEAQNYSAYVPGEGNVVFSPTLAVGMVILLAGAGTTLRASLRRRRAPAYAYVSAPTPRRRL